MVKINKNKVLIFLLIGIAFILFSMQIGSAANATFCCEKTKGSSAALSGLYCQDAPQDQCDTSGDLKAVPTSCASTSYCKPGVCYDASEGNCAGNTPKRVCDIKNGTWSVTSPPQCYLGCCVLGDQAAFVSLVRCKKLSSSLGLQTNYNKNIKDGASCVLSVQNQDKGACVFESEFETTCKFTTRAECTSGINGTLQGSFYKDKLCSAPELGTNCGRTTSTICALGKDEVYFKDTCGNPGNIYDSSKVNDIEYWTNVKTKAESCNPNDPNGNGNSPSCGNCNYLQGSFCRDSKSAGAKVNYGANVCANLNCKNTQNGKAYKHGESWCVYNDKGKTGVSNNPVGSGFYKHICINGEEVLEQCADFRQEECIEDKIVIPQGSFSQAACRVNRWQDCLIQKEQIDSQNPDRRDCTWDSDFTIGSNKTLQKEVFVPNNSPGLNFWEEGSAKQVCAQANTQCVVVYEKDLFGNEKCVEGCECLKQSWTDQRNDLCMAIGDCGPKINWVGDAGYKSGYSVITGNKKKADNKTK